MSTVAARRYFGEGPLSRIAAFVYTVLVVEVMLVAATLPGLVPLLLLDRHPSNVPLAALCALPLAPAVSAAVYAIHHRSGDLTDLHPGARFWRGYRLNLVAVLRIWVPWLAWVAIVGVNLAYFGAAGVPGWWAVLLVVIAVAATLWLANALVIASLFSFRTKDVARLAAYFLARTPGVALANACLLLVAAGVIVLASEAVLALLGAVFVMALVRNSRKMITQVQEEFAA
ncbi:hypothetical protein [Micromonospora sp. CPCC 206061]|uniref:hypothetical protein n=1 Tax=Micromonospora sp. CPCC 206061 TaxID=3122410 RepID=UPI002FF3B021